MESSTHRIFQRRRGWRQLVSLVPAETARRELPVTARAEGVKLVVGTGPTEIRRYPTEGAVGIPATWSKRGARGEAMVRIAPLSSASSELEVEAQAPPGLRGLFWGDRRLGDIALVLAIAIRRELEARRVEEPVAAAKAANGKVRWPIGRMGSGFARP